MAGQGREYEAHPELMGTIAGDVADTVARIAEVIGELGAHPVPRAAFAMLGSPVAEASSRMQKGAVEALELVAEVLAAAGKAVRTAADDYRHADDDTGARYTGLGHRAGR
jgi:DNA-binding ferritin-like protein